MRSTNEVTTAGHIKERDSTYKKNEDSSEKTSLSGFLPCRKDPEECSNAQAKWNNKK